MENKNRRDIYAAFMQFTEMMKLTGGELTPESIDEQFNDFEKLMSQSDTKISKEDADYVKNTLKMNFDINLTSKAVHISDDKITPWIKNAKSSIDWKYWNAYENYLKADGNIPPKSIIQTSEEIDDILDLTGNPKINSDSWSKRGLVMGNVQSGKTLNFTGLINKAVDVGYKFIILIGSINDNNLRMQTQQRVDQGFTGMDTSLYPKIKHIGVGRIRKDAVVVPYTTSNLKDDFNKAFANRQSVDGKYLKPEIPLLFVIKKNKTILENIYDWVKNRYELDPDNDEKRVDSPLLFIDDEADWASPDTSKEDEDPKAINAAIRKILTLFNKTNYIAYTATPFANIFINHETTDEALEDDLFPKDFILKLHLSDAYKGQDFYFPTDDSSDRPYDSIEEISRDDVDKYRPKDDNGKVIRKIDPTDPHRWRISNLTDSLREAVRCFIINNSVRVLRNNRSAHNTMLINVTHRIILMNDLSDCVQEYLEDLKNNIRLSVGLPNNERMQNSHMRALSDTYHKHYGHLSENESFENILKEIDYSVQKIEVRAINSDKAGLSLDYKNYEDVGLSVIAIGGNKLSRGLTLEGLHVSYFDRTSKASDTLTQMCRWFGYRIGYEDLSKVFLSRVYRDHYTNISRIIDDLYQELEYMKLQRRTPREYGIKVREHEGSITITAKNKMRNAKTAEVRVDLWGNLSRYGMFRNDDDINSKNIDIADKFLSKLKSDQGLPKAGNYKDILFNDIDYDRVIKFLTDMDVESYSQSTHAIIKFIETMKKNSCPLFKILLPIITTSKTPAWYKNKKPCDKRHIFEENREIILADEKFQTSYRNQEIVGNFIKYPRLQMASPDDEKVLFSDSELAAIEDFYNKDKLLNKQYRQNSFRNYPLLKLYIYNTFIEKEDNVIIPFSKPSVGFELSFPDVKYVTDSEQKREELSNNIKLSYAYNTVAQQQELEFGDLIDETNDE